MISLLIAAAIGLTVSIFGTPYAIRVFRRRRDRSVHPGGDRRLHGHKQGTPTMGGVVFVTAAVVGYLLPHFE